MVSGKYFVLESDDRFPLSYPTGQWEPLYQEKFNTPSGYYIYALSGHNNVYIGSSKNPNRINGHVSDFNNSTHKNSYMQRVVNKYGLGELAYQCVALIPVEYEQFRNEIENSYIKHFDTYHNGYNMVEFADTPWLGRKMSAEACAKMSEKLTERMAINNPHLGKPKSAQCRANISAALKEVYKTKENHFKGESHTDETREKMGLAKLRAGITLPFYVLSPKGKLFLVESPASFARRHNIVNVGKLRNLRTGRCKICEGWVSAPEKRDHSLCEMERIVKQLTAKKRKEYWFIYEGKVIVIKDLKQYCQQHNIKYSSLGGVYHGSGTARTHKGYVSAKAMQFSV